MVTGSFDRYSVEATRATGRAGDAGRRGGDVDGEVARPRAAGEKPCDVIMSNGRK